MKYEDNIRKVCGDSWRTLPKEERDGGFGLACFIAFLKGVRPIPQDLAAHLQVSVYEIQTGFNRLENNGVFLMRNGYKKDATFQSINKDTIHSWCYIVGIASGATGVSRIN